MTATEALAEVWAGIDGKGDAFRRERDERVPLTDPTCTGHYEGYLAEANEMLGRLGQQGWKLKRDAPA